MYRLTNRNTGCYTKRLENQSVGYFNWATFLRMDKKKKKKKLWKIAFKGDTVFPPRLFTSISILVHVASQKKQKSKDF